MVGSRFGHLPLCKLEIYLIKGDAPVERWSIEADMPLHGILHRTGEYFTVRDIVGSSTNHRTDPLDAESQIGSRTLDMNLIGAIHEGLQSLHAGNHFSIIQRADPEEKFGEGLGAHLSLLRHRGGGPAENDPSGLVDPIIESGTQLL